MIMKRYIYIISLLILTSFSAFAQEDKRDVRRGNREYDDSNFQEAEINYRKALIKDSLSVAANYNLASSLFRQGKTKEAQEILQQEHVQAKASSSEHAADYYYNVGATALANNDWKTAVDAFQNSLLLNPCDIDAKENYIYAKKKLEQQQQQQQQQQQNDQNDDQDQKDQNDQNNQNNQNDQKDQNDQNKDGQNDEKQNQDQDQKDNGDQDKQDGGQNQSAGQEPKITPQAAQQILQAIQDKEKETQEKVKEEKAKALQGRQKERNW